MRASSASLLATVCTALLLTWLVPWAGESSSESLSMSERGGRWDFASGEGAAMVRLVQARRMQSKTVQQHRLSEASDLCFEATKGGVKERASLGEDELALTLAVRVWLALRRL
jgi:hypothetical protein